MLSVSEVCAMYGISQNKVRTLLKTGYLNAVENVKPLKITKDSCNSYFKTEPENVKILKLQTELQTVMYVMNTHIKPLVARVRDLEEKLNLISDEYQVLKELNNGWK